MNIFATRNLIIYHLKYYNNEFLNIKILFGNMLINCFVKQRKSLKCRNDRFKNKLSCKDYSDIRNYISHWSTFCNQFGM